LSNSALKKPVMCAGQNAVAIMIKFDIFGKY